MNYHSSVSGSLFSNNICYSIVMSLFGYIIWFNLGLLPSIVLLLHYLYVFYTTKCLLAYDSSIPVNITFEDCSFPLNCEVITTEVFLSLFTRRMTGRLFLLTLLILSDLLTCYGFRICAFNVQSFGDSKSANAIIMNSVSRVWRWVVKCFYVFKKK